MNVLLEIVRKDLKVYLADRRAVLISLLVPLGIASFMATLFAGTAGGDAKPQRKIQVPIVFEEETDFTRRLFDNLKKDKQIEPLLVTTKEAESGVKKGELSMAMIVPAKFGEKAGASMMNPGDKSSVPELRFLVDPSKGVESQMARGILTGQVMTAVRQVTFNQPASSEGSDMQMPFKFNEETMSGSTEARRSGTVAHAFVGMGVQGILFWAIEAAMGLLRERKLGIWRRLRAAPISVVPILAGRAISVAIRGLLIFVVLFLWGILAFHMQITGSLVGLALVIVATSIMAACFGLFVSALGKTEQQSRGLSILVVLAMTMLSGAWFPSFMMPEWMQYVTEVIPARWAVDGMDMMTWRGLGLTDAILPSVVLLGFSVVFWFLAFRRYRSTAIAE